MGGAQVQLESAKSVQLDQGQLGSVANLTREDLLANLWVAGNIFLDNVLNFGEPTDLPPETQSPAKPPPATGNGPVISSDAIVAPASYPPNGGIVVDQPSVQVGGIASFRGSGCAPGETLSVLFDGSQVGTVPSDGAGNFAGSITIPQGTNPGDHLLTVRGSACELNVVVNVVGAAATRALAFTGSSSHTLTYVLVGFVAVMVGAVLVLGSRRRRSSGAPPSL
jgi:LPXTG-motif cell wall-anchored protein